MANVVTERDIPKMVFALIWAMLGVPLSFGLAKGGTFLMCLLVAILPLALTIWSKRSGFAAADRNFAKLLRMAGMEGAETLGHQELETAIAVDPRQRKILLSAGGAAKAYGYGDVRSWSTRHEGISVFVRDIDHAEWRISTVANRDQARWMEILRQEINESRPESARVRA
jgi:hypothetical protein